jgi:hypothetical protein
MREEHIQVALLGRWIFIGVAEKERVAGLRRDFLRSGDHFGEEGMRHIRENHSNHSRLTGPQTASIFIGMVVKGFNRLPHPLRASRANPLVTVYDSRNRSRGDARQARHVLHRDFLCLSQFLIASS